jgi:hypothetical protein
MAARRGGAWRRRPRVAVARPAAAGGCAGEKGERGGERQQRAGDGDEEDDGGEEDDGSVHGGPAQGCATPRPYHPGQRRGATPWKMGR